MFNSHNAFVLKLDTGYTKLCPGCMARYEEDRRLVGTQRPIGFIWCRKCAPNKEQILRKRAGKAGRY